MAKANDLAQQLRNEADRAVTVLTRIAAQIDALDGNQSALVPVPYRSQHDSDAKYSRLDCGPACIAMLLEWRGTRIAIDDITRMAGSGKTSAVELVAAAGRHGLELRRLSSMSLADIDAQIQAGKPLIVLVRYGDFGDQRQDMAYIGLHWIVVVGSDSENIYIHDPDWWGSRRSEGRDRPISREVFNHAWGNTLPEALSYQSLVIS